MPGWAAGSLQELDDNGDGVVAGAESEAVYRGAAAGG